jgi:hypothetical protein
MNGNANSAQLTIRPPHLSVERCIDVDRRRRPTVRRAPAERGAVLSKFNGGATEAEKMEASERPAKATSPTGERDKNTELGESRQRTAAYAGAENVDTVTACAAESNPRRRRQRRATVAIVLVRRKVLTHSAAPRTKRDLPKKRRKNWWGTPLRSEGVVLLWRLLAGGIILAEHGQRRVGHHMNCRLIAPRSVQSAATPHFIRYLPWRREGDDETWRCC